MTALARSIPRLDQHERNLFWTKVQRAGEDECWIWTGKPDHNGYGVFCIDRVSYRAHRVSVVVAGYAVPTKAVIDHICRNRMCVNPGHLRTVDRFTNVHENSDALAHLNSIKELCEKGHPLSGDNLFIRADGYRGCRECRRSYHKARRAVGEAETPKA